MAADDKIVVLTSVGSEDMALDIAQELVENRCAACVNMIPRLRSVFRWKGKVCDDHESLLIIKTRRDTFDQVVETITEIIDYECPEIIALPVLEGSEKFLNWIDNCLDGGTGDISE
ncbi:MAG TPA: divalent-cation tolerance protein CutA [Acidobacteriota bacterium]|nr:divalent-cation tolerance protein CutA [Acidobacteriota bacterium]